MRFYSEKLDVYYEKYDDYVAIAEGGHRIEQIVIPQELDGLPVKRIMKKAFLGCKLLKKVSIPDTVIDVGDFAFAMCDHLSEISFVRGEIKLGQSCFKGDGEIEKIYLQEKTGDNECTYEKECAASLMALAPIVMSADYLVDTNHGGMPDWYKMWDQKLQDILSRKDDEGYHLYVLCGEEDLHFDYDQYVEYIREKKSGLCIHRLMYDYLLQDKRQLLLEYLKGNVGEGGDGPVFRYLLSAHGDDVAYFELMVKEGIITGENREDLLFMMGDRHPQSKAYLINAFDKGEGNDFFGDLML